MSKPHIRLRAESKPNEERTPLTPAGAKALIDAGFPVTVEEDDDRIFGIEEYRAAGADVAAGGSWINAPEDTIVLGLKELAEDTFPLVHRHIHFAHVFKDQAGADQTLGRFIEGGGSLYDLEYLTDDHGRRVAAFGYWAGYCGAALGVMAFANKAAGDAVPLKDLGSYPSKDDLLAEVGAALARSGRRPLVMVMGAKGRSGRGAVELAEALNLETVQWDREETAAGGPFPAINDADVFVNCVLVASELPPFVTPHMLSAPDRRLSVIADVSCDPYGSYNPIPVYDRITTFDDPLINVDVSGDALHLIAIDHLPSMLPRESSEDYVEQLLPVLLTLDDLGSGAWQRAFDVFAAKTAPLR